MSDLPSLSPEQSAIVAAVIKRQSYAAHWLVEAGAGTGKTTVAVHARAALGGQGTLALTFSNAGQLRFRQVHERYFPDAALARDAVYTFDRLAYEVLCGHDQGVSYSSDGYFTPEEVRRGVVNRTGHMLELLAELVDELNDPWEGDIPAREDDLIRHLELIANVRVANVFRHPSMQAEEEFLDEDDLEQRQDYLASLDLPPWFYDLFTRFEQRRKAAYHLVGVEGAAYDLAGDPKALVRYLKARQIHTILVDEFHDTKALHFDLLRVMAGAGCRLLLIGDRHQDIFAWRGLKPFSAFEAASALPGLEVLTLTRSWRYGHRIARIAERIVQQLQPGAAVTSGARTQQAQTRNTSDLIAWLGDCRAQGVPLDTHCAILPTAADCMALQLRLLDANVPFKPVERVPYVFHGHEFRLLRGLALLYGQLFGRLPAFHVNHVYAFDLLLDVPALYLDPDLRDTLRHGLGLNSARVDGQRLVTGDGAIFGFAVAELVKVLPAELLQPQAWPSWLGAAIKHLQLHALLHQRAQHPAAGRQSGFLLDAIAERFGQTEPAALLEHWDERITRFMKQRHAGALVLTSVLHAKGHEYEQVLLPCGQAGWRAHLLQPTAPRWRELYVAVTRARAGVMLEIPTPEVAEKAIAIFGH